MDGRINEKINNSVRNTGVPDTGAKLDSWSKAVKTCPEVTAKLNRSATPITSPDKARTVSSHSKTPHAFDFRFVASDDEVRQLLVAQTSDERRDVTLISHPDDLSQANLVTRLSISDDGCHALRSGKLFEGSQPLTLVMDIRKLTSGDLPKFNDLLDPDNPCLYDKVSHKKRPLGEHVSLLVLADPTQLASVGQRDDAAGADAPGADFWRRINRPENTWQFNAHNGNTPAKVPPLLAELPSAESAVDDDNTVLIDCHLHSSWRQLLLGGPGVDKRGQIRHIPGRLESLRAGQRVILKGANWKDLAFEQTMRQMLAQKCFESNGKICHLPDDVQFYQRPVGYDELHSLFRALSHPDEAGLSHNPPRTPIIINQSNISEWLSPVAITPEGYAAPNTRLLEQVLAGAVVTVTSPLNEALWFRLLGSLQTIRETTGLEPRLQVAHSRQQPKALGLTENDEQPVSIPQEKTGDQAAFETVIYQQNAQARHWINDHPKAPLVIQVNAQTSFSQLFDNIHITSEQKAHFGRSQSEFQEALTAGKPLVILGLESNPALAQLLEPLIVGQPVLVSGQLQAYPDTHVTLLWPESAQSPSSVLNSMVAVGKPCPEVDIWESNALRHGIHRAELPEQALNEVYEAFGTVPGDLCKPLPEITEGLLNNLILAARRAQQVDQSTLLLPCHWRKAINSVVTHGTRQHPSVRDFMKVACWHLLPDNTPDINKKSDENQAAWVDPDRLLDIIITAPRLDREFVKENLWQLARAVDPAVFKAQQLRLRYGSPFPLSNEEEALDRLCALIAAHGPEEKREAMAYQLEVDPATAEPSQPLAIRPARQIKRLRDALACGWLLILPAGQIRANVIHALATDCFHIARGEYVTENPDSERIERIENRLLQSMKWMGSNDQSLSALAYDLYHGEMSQKDRESRRLSRLHDRLADSPVIFLEGETGTGKSYFSAKMAKASGWAAIISLGPSDSEQTLMKRWQWQEHADGDRSMVQQNRALMEWASTESDKDGGYVGGNYITLVLDEANLAQAGLLASLNGLWEPQPCIYVNGHPVKVSEKHRVILTGNPDHYSGRQMDPALKEKLPKAYYPRLDEAFLRDRVVEPALLNQLQRHQINDIAHIATKSVMALWQYYQELLPEHEFTPRDLTDICSWVGWYLDRGLSKGDSVSCEQVNSLIQQSFRDLLGPEISETQQDALSALEIWFAARYPLDNTLSDNVRINNLKDIQQPFMEFTEKHRPEFDTSGSAVCELVQGLGQDLSRCQQAYHRKIKHGGRQATLIEGPAGRGKDATLNLMIESVKQQVRQKGETMPEIFPLNACDCSWDKVCEAIQKAKVQGGIVVISEMNLIDSQHLEGELNDILAGDAHPGFHLFATINPPQYSGRKPLSPALKGRFRHLPIRQYKQTELQTIAEKVLPQTTEGKFAAKKLTQLHCRLRAYLQRKNLPLQPTSLDLQNVARAVIRRSDFTENGLHQCLDKYYRLYFMAAGLSLEKLPESSALAIGKSKLDSELCYWFNQRVPGISRPWLIRRSDINSIDENNHEIRIEADLSTEGAKTEIIKRVAEAKWQASGLSLKPDQSDDILTRALYRHWQRRWFSREFGRTGVDANNLFPLTGEQEQTLKKSACLPYLREADELIRTWNANEVQCWPAFWQQISDLPNQWLDSSEKYNPEVHEKEATALDQNTNYSYLEQRQVVDHKIFDTQSFSSNMYRWQAEDIYVTAGGDIKLIDINDQHIRGVETLIPDSLPGPDQEVTLTSDQTLATLIIPLHKGRCTLPSLQANDYIVALRIKPELPYNLTRDRYTGLHTLSVPEAEPFQSIEAAYVVEPREADKKTPAKVALPKQAIRLDAHCSEGMKTVLDRLFKTIEGLQDPTEEQRPLWQIKNAKNTTQRIEAIKDYCQQFSGNAVAESNENFFQFLVTKRQGSCRHRVPVFVALCRYFGIPSRQIGNFTHAFAECSTNRGQTWESVNLLGAPVEVTETQSVFQPTRRVSGSGTESKKLKELLKGADLTQQQALAKSCGISIGELNKTFETNGALPKVSLSSSDMVDKLWQEGDLASFSMGVSILLEKETLRYRDRILIAEVYNDDENGHKAMSDAVGKILSNDNADQVIGQLKLLYSKIIAQGGTIPTRWLSSMNSLLNSKALARPPFVRLAHEALVSGWLDPLPTYHNHVMNAAQHHQLLVRLESIDELKVNANHCLKKWYTELFSREKNSHEWRCTFGYLQSCGDYSFFVTHCHGGFSPLLENKMAHSSLQTAWTDEPQGVPNIERMLVHQPAFVRLKPGTANHRPVIMLGRPLWFDCGIIEKVRALIQLKAENSPSLKQLLEDIKAKPDEESSELLENFKKQCWEAIKQAFSHYLYGVTNSNGGCLTYFWTDAYAGSDSCGAHDPSSPEELHAMMFEFGTPSFFQRFIRDDYLRQALSASNALILKPNDLTKIAGEFLDSLNLNSLSESF
ncbi:AAA family ATPase [Endozoicomonas sp. 8E]|uniref:AAA family ATPase n=1 Tax=Endozoicomonas sp. 8E TaxID=3035692 RepID=UPI0029392BF0|nr:AAA family ATPase [Endozoicomonas sp. 8E]WOG28837.1 AAA family ATPase [Endozoicomonas sp. 8E]